MALALQRCFAEGDAVVLIGQAVGRVVAIDGMRMTVRIPEGDVAVKLDEAAGLVRHAVKKREARNLLASLCARRPPAPGPLVLAEIGAVLGVHERHVRRAVHGRNPELAARGTKRRVLPLAPEIEGSSSVRSFWVDDLARAFDVRIRMKPGAWHAYVFERGAMYDELVGIHARHAELGVDVPLSIVTVPLNEQCNVRVDDARRATAVFVANA